jgi:hypothetical protein
MKNSSFGQYLPPIEPMDALKIPVGEATESTLDEWLNVALGLDFQYAPTEPMPL